MLRGENKGKVYRLGDRVNVQVVKVDMERRQVDLGLVEILDAVRESESNRGPRRSKAQPREERGKAKGSRRKSRGRENGSARRESGAERKRTSGLPLVASFL